MIEDLVMKDDIRMIIEFVPSNTNRHPLSKLLNYSNTLNIEKISHKLYRLLIK